MQRVEALLFVHSLQPRVPGKELGLAAGSGNVAMPSWLLKSHKRLLVHRELAVASQGQYINNIDNKEQVPFLFTLPPPFVLPICQQYRSAAAAAETAARCHCCDGTQTVPLHIGNRGGWLAHTTPALQTPPCAPKES